MANALKNYYKTFGKVWRFNKNTEYKLILITLIYV